MEAWKGSLAGARVGSPLRCGEGGEAERSDGAGDATAKSHRESGCGGGGSPQQTEAVVQSFQGEGNWSSRVVTLMTLCAPVREVAFCPLVWWGGEIPMWDSGLGGGTLSAGQGASAVASGA